MKTKTQISISKTCKVVLTSSDILEMVRDCMNEDIPADALVTVHVPGGGGRSNMDLAISLDSPVKIQWTVKETPNDF